MASIVRASLISSPAPRSLSMFTRSGGLWTKPRRRLLRAPFAAMRPRPSGSSMTSWAPSFGGLGNIHAGSCVTALERNVICSCRIRWLWGQSIGLERAVSDFTSIVHVQDVLVDPAHQRRGIGRQLDIRALEPFAGVRQKVLLRDTEPGQKSFYESLGFSTASAEAGTDVRAFVKF